MFSLSVLISFLFTWVLGLAVPVLLRYKILKRPVSKGIAFLVVFIVYIVQFFISLSAGNEGRHTALALVGIVGFGILNTGYAEYLIKKSVYGKEEIPNNLDLEKHKICPNCQNEVHINATLCNKCHKELRTISI